MFSLIILSLLLTYPKSRDAIASKKRWEGEVYSQQKFDFFSYDATPKGVQGLLRCDKGRRHKKKIKKWDFGTFSSEPYCPSIKRVMKSRIFQ